MTRCACGEACFLHDLVQTGESFCCCGHNSGVGFGDCPTFSGTWYCDHKAHSHNYPMEKHCGQVSHVAVVKQLYPTMLQTLAAELFRLFSHNPASKATFLSFFGKLRQHLLKTSNDLIKRESSIPLWPHFSKYQMSNRWQ